MKRSVQTRGFPIIFITVRVSEEDEIFGFTLGAVDYITKPFSEVVVRARVGMHAELKRHRDYLESISYLDDMDDECAKSWNSAAFGHSGAAVT